MQPNAQIPEFALSIDAVAERLEVSRSTVTRLIASGRLRSFKVGKCRRVSAAALRECVAELERQAANEAGHAA